MGDTKELKRIKKIYGENFKNLCRELFPVIIEQEGKLLEILEKKFSHNCDSLYEVITKRGLVENFKELIFSEFDLTREEKKEEEERTPHEILEEQGYDLIECKSEEDIQGFRKYYAPNEVLCTIYNGGRLETRDCFFAVRKDVDKIRREDFKNPDKSDEYSTSVLGIQFTRDKRSTVQIISRYNHTVPNPNCTLGNDLDRLAPGLSQSFANLLKERGLRLTIENREGFEMPGYTLANDGRYYKYNMEINGEYFCPGNIVISNGEARDIGAPEKGLLIDYFYIDFQNKTVKDMRCNAADDQRDAFVDAFENIEKIEVEKTESANKVIRVHIQNEELPAIIEIDRDNQIVSYINDNIRKIGKYFLCGNEKMRKIRLLNLQEVGSFFLWSNNELRQIEIPKVERIGSFFLAHNKKLGQIEVPNLREVGSNFLYSNNRIIQLEMPELRETGSGFLEGNRVLKQAKMPKLKIVGNGFLSDCRELNYIEVPELETVGNDCLCSNEELRQIEMPKLKKAGDCFLRYCRDLVRIKMPELQQLGNFVLMYNEALSELEMPKLREAGRGFLYSNEALKEVELPNLEDIGADFLYCNKVLEKVNIPKIPKLEKSFKEITDRNVSAVDEKDILLSRIKFKVGKVKEQLAEIKALYQERKEQKSNGSKQRDQ